MARVDVAAARGSGTRRPSSSSPAGIGQSVDVDVARPAAAAPAASLAAV